MKRVLGCLVWVFWGTLPLSASQALNFGLEARSTGRAGSVTADPFTGQAALLNPALLGLQTTPRLSFSTAQAEMALKSSDSGTKALPSVSQTRWALGLNIPISLKRFSRRAGFGISASGPYEKLRGFVAYAPEDFYTPRYGHADSQFKGTASFGLELVPDTLFLGAGLSLYLSGAGNAETYVSETPSSRMSLDVVLRSAPVLGLYSQWGAFASALTFHEAINPQLEQAMKAKVQLNGRDAFEQPLLMKSSLYYEPRTLEWDLEHRFSAALLSLGLSYQLWSGYEAPILSTETPDLLGNVYRTPKSSLVSKNTLSPRASVGYGISSEVRSSLGYQYRPTPFPELAENSHALDTDTHVVGLSLEKSFSNPWMLETPLTIGLFGQMHFFKERPIPTQNFNLSGNAYLVGISAQADL